jgi:hypothetical protein
MNNDKFTILFNFSLLITLILSFYIFVRAIFFSDNNKKKVFNSWQFPMLLALYIDAVYILQY